MLGFRTTQGSCNGIILTKETLFLMFNTIYNVRYYILYKKIFFLKNRIEMVEQILQSEEEL